MEKVILYLLLTLAIGLNIYLLIWNRILKSLLNQRNELYNGLIQKLHEQAQEIAKGFNDVKQF